MNFSVSPLHSMSIDSPPWSIDSCAISRSSQCGISGICSDEYPTLIRRARLGLSAFFQSTSIVSYLASESVSKRRQFTFGDGVPVNISALMPLYQRDTRFFSKTCTDNPSRPITNDIVSLVVFFKKQFTGPLT